MQTHHETDDLSQPSSQPQPDLSPQATPLTVTALRVWRASLCGALGVALLELITLFIGSNGETALGGTALHIMGLYTLFTSLYAVLCVIFLPSLIVSLPTPARWFGLKLSAPERVHYLQRAFTWGVALSVLVGVVSAATLTSRGFNRDLFAVAWAGIATISSVLLIALVTPALNRFIGWIIIRLCPQAMIGPIPLSILPTCIVGLVIFGGGVGMSRVNLGAYQLDGYLLFGLMLLLSGVIYAGESWWRGRATTKPSPVQSRSPLIYLVGTVVLGSIFSLWTLSGWTVAHPSNQLIPQQAQLSQLILSVARRVTDGDGDGVSALLGGGDCDDNNAQVSPLQREIPDNGVDDNCANGDASTPKPPEPPPQVKPDEERPKPKAWNVIFLLVDTLRASHLPTQGYQRPTMPHLARFAEEAVVFNRAFAHAPRTPFSIPSALIGRYPSRLKWVKRFKNYSVLTDENETFFERFQGAGWRTEAVSAHWYFGKKKAVNLNQGLDRWDNRGERSVSESNTQSEAKQITQRLIARMRSLREAQQGGGTAQPFVLFGHYFAPHGRYMNHRVKCKRSKKWCHVEPRCAEHPTQCVFGDPKAKSVQKLINKYDSELAYTDLHLGDVFKAYRELGLDRDTILVVTSDHGESFKDRKPKYLFHGHHVYNEELHVPLMIRTPESRPQRRDEVVGLVDVSPTLSELTGAPRGVVDGVSLAPLLRSEEPKDEELKSLRERVLFLEQLPYPGHKVHMVAGVGGGGLKIVRNLTAQTWETFDLTNDWSERRSLKTIQDAQLASEAKRVRARLSQFIELTP